MRVTITRDEHGHANDTVAAKELSSDAVQEVSPVKVLETIGPKSISFTTRPHFNALGDWLEYIDMKQISVVLLYALINE